MELPDKAFSGGRRIDTDWNEAVSFISAALGASFDHSDGDSLEWLTFGKETTLYTVQLRPVSTEVEINVNLTAIRRGTSDEDVRRFYAIIGWAYTKKHMLDVEI